MQCGENVLVNRFSIDHWVAILAPESCSTFLSYITGMIKKYILFDIMLAYDHQHGPLLLDGKR